MNEGIVPSVIRRWECQDCGRDLDSLARPGFCADDRCNGEMVEVEYVRREGAVETLERIRDHANSAEDAAVLAQKELDRMKEAG